MDSNWLIESVMENHKQKESYLIMIARTTDIKDTNYAAVITRFHMN